MQYEIRCSNTYHALQDLFLGCGGLSPLQWHPYSTVGGERPHTLVAHIKAYGQCVFLVPFPPLRIALVALSCPFVLLITLLALLPLSYNTCSL